MHTPEQHYINLCFQVHQPRRLRNFGVLDAGADGSHFNDAVNQDILNRIAVRCYLPANNLLLDLLNRFPQIRITFSISGTALEQFEQFAPEVLDSFRRLVETGAVEILGETFYHSLACMLSKEEFSTQVERHRKTVRKLLGVTPTCFRNTELIYSDSIGRTVSDLGFTGVYSEGADRLLQGRTPNNIYHHPDRNLKLLLRNYRLSDDIAFRFNDRQWCEAPLSGKKIAEWIEQIPAHEHLVTLAMDYETFGEHHRADSGIFSFLREFLSVMAEQQKRQFINPTAACRNLSAQAVLSVSQIASWADEPRDLSAWLGNSLQRDAFDSLCRLHDGVLASSDQSLIETYRHLQTSDHFYYMATPQGCDGDVHRYFSPYESPYAAFMNFMNIVFDLECRLERCATGPEEEMRTEKFCVLPA
jgi:alpha-amylase